MVRYSDLTPAEQRMIRTGRAQPATVKTRARKTAADTRPAQWQCQGRAGGVPCGQTFTAWVAAQSHADAEHGGGRIELLLWPTPAEKQ